MINFSTALVIFTILFSVLFTTLLTLYNNDTSERKISIKVIERNGERIIKSAFALGVITLFLTLYTNIRAADELLYYSLVTAISILLITSITFSKDKSLYIALPTIITLHLTICTITTQWSGSW